MKYNFLYVLNLETIFMEHLKINSCGKVYHSQRESEKLLIKSIKGYNLINIFV